MARELQTTKNRPRRGVRAGTALACAAVLAGSPVQAQRGKLALTGGVGSIDGAAGGGLTPWALTASLATEGETGGTLAASTTRTPDFSLATAAVTLAWDDRLELSLAQQDLDAGDNLAPLGLRGLHLKQRIVGAKLRLAGDAVLDSDRWWPQLAIGVQHKRADPGALAPTLFGVLGARRSGVDVYVSATKLLLAQGLLVNATLRATRANQNGLLGFGAAQGGGTRLQPELSLAWLAGRGLALGAEYRRKPDALAQSALGPGVLKEDDWFDLFAVWAPVKAWSLTLAWVDLGRIAPGVQPRRQRGAHLAAQLSF